MKIKLANSANFFSRKNTKLAFNKMKYWLLANAIGLALFLFFASQLWPDLAEQDIHLEMRDDTFFQFLGTCIPTLLLFFLINIAWLIQSFMTILKERFHGIRGWFWLLTWLLVVASWVIVFKYDRYRAWTETPRIQEMRQRGEL